MTVAQPTTSETGRAKEAIFASSASSVSVAGDERLRHGVPDGGRFVYASRPIRMGPQVRGDQIHQASVDVEAVLQHGVGGLRVNLLQGCGVDADVGRRGVQASIPSSASTLARTNDRYTHQRSNLEVPSQGTIGHEPRRPEELP